MQYGSPSSHPSSESSSASKIDEPAAVRPSYELGTVFIVDDDEAVRDSLRWLLESNGYAVRCYDSGEAFLEEFIPGTAAVLILDVRMPGMSGLELQAKLAEKDIHLPIVFITGHGDVPMAVSTIKKGASDFIEKPFNESELRQLIGRLLLEAHDAARVYNERKRVESRMSRLTTREQQVLERIVAGRLNKQIADDLGISIKTVEAHRANIMEKLGAANLADLVKVTLKATQ